MKIRTACITVGATALALPAFAEKPQLQSLSHGIRVEPIAIGTAQIINGQLVRTSPMYPYTPGGNGTRVDWSCAWDSFESDTYDPNLGVPTGGDVCPNANFTPDTRWWFGAAYVNPFVSGDMSDLAATSAEGMFTSWGWQPLATEQCTMLVFPTDTYADCTTAVPNDGIDGSLAGVILDFGPLAAGAGYYYTAIDFTVTPILSLDLTGATGNIIIYSQTAPADGPPFTLASATQPMLWGTTEDDLNAGNDTRCGTQADPQYDDDAPTDGVHDLVVECYSYVFGVCPDPLGMSLSWVSKGGSNPCACAGDLNGDGIVDIADLALFLSQFGSSDGGCDDINNDGVTDISDLALILSAFGSACP